MAESSAEVSVGLARIEGLFRELGVPLVESWAPGLHGCRVGFLC